MVSGVVTTGAFTVTANAASEALEVPSLTDITMPEVVPTAVVAGVPDSWPEAMLNVAQLGLFCTLKLRVLPLGSVVVGVKLYAVPAVTEVAGVPEIVGAAVVVPPELPLLLPPELLPPELLPPVVPPLLPPVVPPELPPVVPPELPPLLPPELLPPPEPPLLLPPVAPPELLPPLLALLGLLTRMEKAGSVAVVVPSVALITIPE